MVDPATTALIAALDNSTKVANTPLISTVLDRMLGFKISEWAAQGEAIKKQILDGYEEAKQKGLGIQYVSAFRSNANLINTSVKAAKYIGDTVNKNIEIDNDVFWGLLEHSKSISNDEMQELVARILAGEYNAPGTYTMSTMQTIKMLGQREVKLFEKMCALIVNDEEVPKVLFSSRDETNKFLGEIHFGSLQMLQSLGLFLPNDMIHEIPNPEKKLYRVSYFDEFLTFAPEGETPSPIKSPGYYGLSEVGKQIRPHVDPIKIPGYFEWLKKHYKVSGYKLVE